MGFTTYAQLRDAVEQDNGVFKADMYTLKELKGAGRLGRHVRDSISRDLASHGMGHLPLELPSYQEEEVRLYLLGSTTSEIVRAVTAPSDNGDQVLRSVGDNQAQRTLTQVRDLVCA